jgi:hypothetical protein
MDRRSFVVLGVALAVACGQTPARPADVAPNTDLAAPTADKLFVARADGLSIVDVATGKVIRDLPAGITSADRSTHFVVETGESETVLRIVEAKTGVELKQMAISGQFDLPDGYGPRADALSHNGRLLVLAGPAGAKSSFVVVDTTDLRETARVDLAGAFTFDAIDEQGRSLYLLEHPQPNSHLYNVRMYDLTTNVLSPRAIVDQKASSPTAEQLARGTMGGIYHASTTAAGFHFGFYTHPTRGPVIHSLHLSQRWARCLIDLADRQTHRSQWAIVTSPKEDVLYAVNAGTGAFASVRTSDLQVTARSLRVDEAPEGALRGSAVVSADGTRLYAAGGKGVLVVDPRAGTLKGQFLTDREFVSVMVSTDGTRLYVLDAAGAISRIEPNTGRDLGIVARLPAAVSLLRVD